ncbi:hypothetical protein QEN19_002305 [Hanseniaspora menglaensis]
MEDLASDLTSFLLSGNKNQEKSSHKRIKNRTHTSKKPKSVSTESNGKTNENLKERNVDISKKNKNESFEKKKFVFVDKADEDFFSSMFEKNVRVSAHRSEDISEENKAINKGISKKKMGKNKEISNIDKKESKKSNQSDKVLLSRTFTEPEVSEPRRRRSKENRQPSAEAEEFVEPENAGPRKRSKENRRQSTANKFPEPENAALRRRSKEKGKKEASLESAELIKPNHKNGLKQKRNLDSMKASNEILKNKSNKARLESLLQEKNQIKTDLVAFEKSLFYAVECEEEFDNVVFTMFRNYIQEALFVDYYKRDYDAFQGKDTNGELAMVLSKKFELLSVKQKIHSLEKEMKK